MTDARPCNRRRVVFNDVRVGKAMQVHIDQRQAHHVGRDVVALEVLRQAALVVWSQRAVALVIDVGFEDVLVGGDQKAGGAAGGVEEMMRLCRYSDLDDEVDDVARGAELPGVTLRAEHR